MDWITFHCRKNYFWRNEPQPSSMLKIPTGLGVGPDVLDTNAGDVRYPLLAQYNSRLSLAGVSCEQWDLIESYGINSITS